MYRVTGGGGGEYTSLISYIDNTVQVGLLDAPQNVKFGAGGVSPNGLVSLAPNGILTVLKTGYYQFKTRLRAQRSGAAGVSHVFTWIEISVNNGVSWVTVGNSVDVQLSASDDTIVMVDFSSLFAVKGMLLRSRFARSSTGNNSGDLRPADPGSVLLAEGCPIAPSAALTVYTSNNGIYT